MRSQREEEGIRRNVECVLDRWFEHSRPTPDAVTFDTLERVAVAAYKAGLEDVENRGS